MCPGATKTSAILAATLVVYRYNRTRLRAPGAPIHGSEHPVLAVVPMSHSDYWQQKFPDMRPVTRAPGLFTLNGIGTMVYGRRDHDAETDTYVATLCFCVLFIPVLALRAYRVAGGPEGWYFIGRVPLSGLARGWNFLVLVGLVLGAGGFLWLLHARNPETVAANLLAEGDRLAEAGQAGQAAHK